ncbi:MAG: BatA domain-containing protein, partial [Lentisphaerae bacterium]|nr:BatA domain-containing protein [Lentisphaerota bacterium]
MPFLNPLLLWGLTALALPVLLLLFLNRRKRVLRWAAYEWMLHAVVVRKRRIRTDNLLKLISKLLLIAAIVLMMARPFFRSKGGTGNTLVIVDTSPSMAASYENGTRLDQAKAVVGDFIRSYEGRLSLYSFDGAMEPIVAEYTDDKKALADGLKGLRTGSTYAGASTLFDEIRGIASLVDAKRIYMAGDFQAQWYGNGPRIVEHMKQLGKAYPMVWHQVDSRSDLRNCAIEKLDLSPEGAFLGRETFLRVSLLNGTQEESGSRTLSLHVDDQRKARVTVNLEPGESRDIPFSVRFTEPGRHNVTARLDPDVCEEDDCRYAVIDVPPRLTVLAVVPSKGRSPYPFDTYVRAALQSLLPGEALSYKSITPADLFSVDLTETDILLAVRVPMPASSPHAERIKEFVEGGRAVVAFLPAEDETEGALFGIEGGLVERPCRVNRSALSGTYLDFMRAPGLKPQNIEFTRGLIFKDILEKDARLVVDEGVIALSREVGKGRIVILGFTPYHGYTNLHFNPNFLQMMLRLLHEALGRHTLYSVTGSPPQWSLPGLGRDRSYT